MAKNNKQPRNKSGRSTKRKPSSAVTAVQGAPVAPGVTSDKFVSSGDARRDSLLRQIRAAEIALERESATGFGERSERAARNLKDLNEQLKAYDKESRANNPVERAYKIGLAVGAPVAGMYVGHKLAGRLKSKTQAMINAKNAQLKEIGNRAKIANNAQKAGAPGARSTAEIKAISNVAKKLKLDKAKGPIGGVTAALLVAEGLYSREVLANSVDNEAAQEALKQVGTASVFAASTLLGERIIDNATADKQLKADALVDIEKGKNLVANKKKPAIEAADMKNKSKSRSKPKNPIKAVAVSAVQADAVADSAKKASKGSPRQVSRGAAANSADDLIKAAKGALAMPGASKEKAEALSKASAAIQAAKLPKAEAQKLAGELLGTVPKSTSAKSALARSAKLLDSTATTVYKILAVGGRGVSAVAPFLAPALAAAAAVGAVSQSAEAGEASTVQTARGALAALDSATLGVAGMVSEAVKSRQTYKIDHRAMGEAQRKREAERIAKAHKLAVSSTTKRRPTSAPSMASRLATAKTTTDPSKIYTNVASTTVNTRSGAVFRKAHLRRLK